MLLYDGLTCPAPFLHHPHFAVRSLRRCAGDRGSAGQARRQRLPGFSDRKCRRRSAAEAIDALLVSRQKNHENTGFLPEPVL